MQNTQAQGGKLESIKSVGELLPKVNDSLNRCGSARHALEEMISNLTNSANEIVKAREAQSHREQKQAEYADLIKQRQEEREQAERRVDERISSKKPTATAKKTEVQKPEAKSQTQTQAQSHGQQAAQPQQTFTPRTDGGRPPYPPRDPNRQFTPREFPPRQFGNANQGTRPPYSPNQNARPWAAPGSRTFTPRTDGQQRPPFPPRDPNRPFPPRDGQRPYPPRDPNRPFVPRTPGAPRPGSPLGVAKPTERFIPKADTFSGKKKVKSFDNSEKSSMDRRALLRRGIIEEQEIEERMLTRIFKTKKAKENNDSPREKTNIIVINANTISVKTLSEKIGKPVTEIIKQLMILGNMCNINSTIDFETAALVSMEFGLELQLDAVKTSEEKLGDIHKKDDEESGKLESRPPVVTVMGHVDHGKTSLLDAIRKTKVTAGEHGGITQHIGAYQVSVAKKGKITFIDTPGHAAFEKMRARSSQITDIAILIVAGDDGVMPQTIESIKHIQKNNLPMIVACNKMDKKESNIDRVKEQLAMHNVLTEEWGGEAILVPISATTGMGLDKLLDMILLVAEMNNYRANPNKEAQGSIIDAQKDATRGAVVTVLVRSGTLKIGDTLLAGTSYGKVRKMTDENGKALRVATPGTPVQVLGFSEVPKAGDECYVVDDKLTKQVVSERKGKEKVIKSRAGTKDMSAIDVIASLDKSAKKQLNVIIKGDVSGSVEAIIQSMKNITSDEVNVNVISSGVGAINDNDVALAEVASALLVAFNVKASATAATLARKQKVKIHSFTVIYQIFDFVTEQMVRMFEPKFNDVYYGRAEVLALFKSSAIGLIAGCMVRDGKIVRDTKMKLVRGKDTIGEYKLDSLKIKKDDVKEVASGFECGIKLDTKEEIKVGDIIECIGKEQQPIIFEGRKYEF